MACVYAAAKLLLNMFYCLPSLWYSHEYFFFKLPLSAGKSSVLLDVKPWDDETDMKKLEEAVRSVEMEGLFWGACMFFILILLLITFEL